MVVAALTSMLVRVGDVVGNWLRLRRYASLAALRGAELVVFPEYCLTGFRGWWFGDALLYWELLNSLRALARRLGIYLVAGLLEPPHIVEGRADCTAFNSTVLIDPKGDVLLKHRKWEEPILFCRGSEVRAVNTPLGRLAVIICGDLFSEDVREHVRKLSVDYLIIPMDRSGTPGIDYKLEEEVEAMGEAVRECCVRRGALIVNAHGHEGSYGFALILDASGKPLKVLTGEGTLLSKLP